jgi:hypothetical protein
LVCNAVNSQNQTVSLSDLSWQQVLSGDCYKLVPGPNGKLFVPRRTDLMRSYDNGSTWQNANWPLGIVRSSTSLHPGAVYNFSTNQYIQCALDNGYWVSNDDGNSFTQTGPTGFGTGGVEMLALNNGQVLASNGGFLRGVYKSNSIANTGWINKYSGVDSYDFVSFNDVVLFSATSNNLLKSTNQGDSWVSLFGGNYSDVEKIQDSLCWISSSGNFYIEDKDLVSVSVAPRYNFGSGYFDMRYDPINGILAVTKNSGGVFLSTDNGHTWTTHSINGATAYNDLCFYENSLYVGTNIGLYSTSVTFTQYQWSNGSSTNTISVTPTTNTTYTCTVTQSNSTCTASIDITVNPAVTNAISASIIEGESYTLGTQTLTTAGTYSEVFTSTAGCDSTVTLTLSVEPLLTCNITAPTTTLCAGESVNLSISTTGGVGSSAQLTANLEKDLFGFYPFSGNANDISTNHYDGVVSRTMQ